MTRRLVARSLAIEHAEKEEFWHWIDGDEVFPEYAKSVGYLSWLQITGVIKSAKELLIGKEYTVLLVYKLTAQVQGLKLPSFQKATIEYNGETREKTLNLDSDRLEPYTGGNGLYQIMLGEFRYTKAGVVRVTLQGSDGTQTKSGLIVAGMEFVPEGIEVVPAGTVVAQVGQENRDCLARLQEIKWEDIFELLGRIFQGIRRCLFGI